MKLTAVIVALFLQACAGFNWGRAFYVAGGGHVSKTHCVTTENEDGEQETECEERRW